MEDQFTPEEYVGTLYPELRKLAARQLSRAHNLTLQPTEFVNELYLKLANQSDQAEQISKQHFVFLAAKIFRQLLADHLRKKASAKRGGPDNHLADITLSQIGDEKSQELISGSVLTETLDQLDDADATAARIVELKIFGGYSGEEIAGMLEIGTATVTRKWSMAKAFLRTNAG